MFEKHSNATANRPDSHTIDALSVFINTSAFIQQIKTEEAWQKYDRNAITVFKSAEMRIVAGALHKDAEMEHKAEGMMSIQVLSGLLDVTTDELSVTLGKDQIVAIHKDQNYKILAAEEVTYLLTICDVA